jgi:hypothetical protein
MELNDADEISGSRCTKSNNLINFSSYVKTVNFNSLHQQHDVTNYISSLSVEYQTLCLLSEFKINTAVFN